MTTNTKYTENSKLYRMLEDMGRDIKHIGAAIRGMNDSVGDLLSKTDCIYDAVTRHPESRYDVMNGNEFLDDTEE